MRCLSPLERRPTNVVLIAMANKVARIVWAMLVKNESYQAPTNKKEDKPVEAI